MGIVWPCAGKGTHTMWGLVCVFFESILRLRKGVWFEDEGEFSLLSCVCLKSENYGYGGGLDL